MTDSKALVRIGFLAVAVVFSAASGASHSGYQARPAGGSGGGGFAPPPSQPMDPAQVVGLYSTSFGPVKIELDAQKGASNVAGVWVYEREGEEVIGLFQGELDGNVLEFVWQEPTPQGSPLMGNGFLVFHADGTGFYGKWWTTSRDRSGDWSGQKHQADAPSEQGPAEQAPELDDEPSPYADERTI